MSDTLPDQLGARDQGVDVAAWELLLAGVDVAAWELLLAGVDVAAWELLLYIIVRVILLLGTRSGGCDTMHRIGY